MCCLFPGVSAQAYLFLVHLLLGHFPSLRLDCKMHKRQVISPLLAPCWHRFMGTLLGKGTHFGIKCGVISKWSFEGWSPGKDRQEEKIGELSEKHVVGQFNQG